MDNQFDIEKYFEGLPDNVRDFIDGDEWQARTRQVAEKYGLRPEQTESLANNVCLYIVGLTPPESLQADIEEDLGISPIVSEQILDDLDGRVFDFALKTMTGEKKIEAVTRSPIQKVLVPVDKNTYSERTDSSQSANSFNPNTPPNLPVADEDKEFVGQKVDIPRYVPTRIENIREEVAQKYEETKNETLSQMSGSSLDQDLIQQPGFTSPIGSKITYKSAAPAPTSQAEVTQNIFQIPRINLSTDAPAATPAMETPERAPAPYNIDPTPNTSTQTAYSPKESLQEEVPPPDLTPQPKPAIPIVKSYTVDPYREPLQ